MASFADGENHFVGMDDCVHFVYKIGVWGWVANEDTGIDKFDDGAIIAVEEKARFLDFALGLEGFFVDAG